MSSGRERWSRSPGTRHPMVAHLRSADRSALEDRAGSTGRTSHQPPAVGNQHHLIRAAGYVGPGRYGEPVSGTSRDQQVESVVDGLGIAPLAFGVTGVTNGKQPPSAPSLVRYTPGPRQVNSRWPRVRNVLRAPVRRCRVWKARPRRGGMRQLALVDAEHVLNEHGRHRTCTRFSTSEMRQPPTRVPSRGRRAASQLMPQRESP